MPIRQKGGGGLYTPLSHPRVPFHFWPQATLMQVFQ